MVEFEKEDAAEIAKNFSDIKDEYILKDMLDCPDIESQYGFDTI
jgi:hypothetical protein